MTTTLTFGLGEEEEARTAMDAAPVRAAISDFDQTLRNRIKHDSNLAEDHAAVYETVRELLREKLTDWGVDPRRVL